MYYLVLYFLFICFDNPNYFDLDDSFHYSSNEFEFKISGTVDGLDGTELSLYIPSQGLDARIKATISNGEYSFKGRASDIELAEIRFEENIIYNSDMFSTTHVIIEKGTTVLHFTIEGASMLKYTTDHEVEAGRETQFYYKTHPIMDKARSTWVFSDSIRIDSMIRHEYPAVRERVFKAYSEICSDQLHEDVCLIYLHDITLGFNGTGAFNSHILTADEKMKFNSFLSDIDDLLHERLIYKKIKKSIEDFFEDEEKIEFTEYRLENISGGKSSISKIIKANNFSILYFWWSGCGPCRKFNKDNQKYYSTLKQKGIEIISINVDQSKERWIKSSEKDNITWVNLYAGISTLIMDDYKVSAFPTKLVFNQKGILVDLDFKSLSELSHLNNE